MSQGFWKSCGILHEWLRERRGESNIRLIPERRILLCASAMVCGVVIFHTHGLANMDFVLVMIAGVAAFAGVLGLLLQRRGFGPALGLLLIWFIIGLVAAAVQQARMPPPAGISGQDATVTGTLEFVDGRAESRFRLWLRVLEIKTATGNQDAGLPHQTPHPLIGHVVRLSIAAEDIVLLGGEGNLVVGQGGADVQSVMIGDRLLVKARLYPPPAPVLYGAPNHALQARARDVLASGFVTGSISRLVPVAGFEQTLSVSLAALRQLRADRIRTGMDDPAGGIAAALLIGDRRFVDEDIYDLFRHSGLAHLLAISGLHMGLLCFGVIGLVRFCAALFPRLASRLPVHKIAAISGLLAAAGYVLLSGASISASRAFIMACLIILAVLVDRLAITLRNVALAAIVLLLVNPLALFTAGFQLSFAATLALVLWYEARNPLLAAGRQPMMRVFAWGRDLIMASIVASLATLPFTAQHFGAITPWGVLANLFGIPLTGLWIMPAGLAVLITQFVPVSQALANLALLAMEIGITVLVAIAGWFADLPFAPLSVRPPGNALLLAGFLLLSVLASFRPTPPSVPIGGAATDEKRHRYADRHFLLAFAIICSLGLVWARGHGPDAVYFARGMPSLVVPVSGANPATGPEGPEAVILPLRGKRDPSRFLVENTTRVLAVKRADIMALETGWVTVTHDAVGAIAIVGRRAPLTAACRADTAIVLAATTVSYPCRDGTPIFSLKSLPPDNYLLTFNLPSGAAASAGDAAYISAIGSAGQYFRINPVSRP